MNGMGYSPRTAAKVKVYSHFGPTLNIECPSSFQSDSRAAFRTFVASLIPLAFPTHIRPEAGSGCEGVVRFVAHASSAYLFNIEHKKIWHWLKQSIWKHAVQKVSEGDFRSQRKSAK
jgi:hypothetical protein